jgi:hypothetical protein
MAKLSAHGQELIRLERENKREDGVLIWERDTVTLCSDYVVLRKRDVRFSPDRFHPNGRLHHYGWKRVGKLELEPDSAQRFIEYYEEKGYECQFQHFNTKG